MKLKPYAIAIELRRIASRLTLLDVMLSGNPERMIRRIRNYWIGSNVIPRVWESLGVKRGGHRRD